MAVSFGERLEKSALEPDVEDHDSNPLGLRVGVVQGKPANETFGSRVSQVICRLRAGLGTAGQRVHLGAEAPVGEADDFVTLVQRPGGAAQARITLPPPGGPRDRSYC